MNFQKASSCYRFFIFYSSNEIKSYSEETRFNYSKFILSDFREVNVKISTIILLFFRRRRRRRRGKIYCLHIFFDTTFNPPKWSF